MAKLSERAIRDLACPPDRQDRLVFDDTLPGLAVRVASNGRKTFLVQYTAAGRKRRVPLGRWGALTLEQARAAARGVLGDVARGQDVAGHRAEVRVRAAAQARAERLTLAVLLEDWAALALANRRETYRREAVRAVRVAFAHHLSRPAGTLTRVAAVQTLDQLVKAGHGAMAGRTLAYARACYGWARRRGVVPDNPFQGLPIPTGAETRDRVLSDAELGAIWRATGRMGWPFGPLLRLLLLTAQRRDEVAAMRWADLSDDLSLWTVPKEHAKNGRAHLVHLAPAARDVLAALPRLGDTDLVFSTNGRTPVSGFSKAKARLDQLSGVRDWRLHDFRRTAVTRLAGAGVAPHVADRLLNHVEGAISGVAAVYQRNEFLPERKRALEAWAAHVLAVGREAGGDAAPFHKAG